MKTGLMGGSFDPVHAGHLRAAEEISEKLGLDEVVFIPTLVSPHKSSEAISHFSHRLNMLNLSVKRNPRFKVSDMELRREPPSYTIDTLRSLNKTSPQNEYYFIMGSELFAEIDTWKDFAELFNYSSFVVLRRPGYEFPDSPSPVPLALENDFRYSYSDKGMDVFAHTSSNELFFVDIAGIKVSSTEIRELARRGNSLGYLVAREVEGYIAENGLYQLEEKP